MATNVRDPRSIVTPDAFEIDAALLGTPLAPPGRRAFALLIDLIVIGTLTAITSSVTLILWGVVAVFFITMAFRRPGDRMGQVTSMLFRGATGCLGTVILMGVGIGFLASRSNDGIERLERTLAGLDERALPATPAAPGGVRLLQGLAGAAAFRQAPDSTRAREALERMLETLWDSGLSDDEMDDAARGLESVVPADVTWRGDLAIIRTRALAAVRARREAPTPAEALEDSPSPISPGDLAALPPEVAAVVADTLAALSDSLDEVRGREAEARRDLAHAHEALESGQGGFLALVRDIWDQLGSAIGLWSVYFTVALTVTRGRTVGKKAMGLRVIRLDGQPITWWFAFERAGGYVAGIATGLLGFAQIWWDPNRQCVHDKIGGTVVVMDGAAPIPGAWQEAWRQQQEEAER
jgi:hypothetical protein